MSRTTKQTWRHWLAKGVEVNIVLTLVLALTALPVWLHTREVRKAENEHAQLVERNHLWTLLAQGEADDTVVGALARDLKPKMAAENPIKELLETYVEPGAYPEIEDVLGIDVYDDEESETGRSTYEQGFLSAEFVVQAAQATPENVDDLLQDANYELPEDGIRSWENYGLLLLVPSALLALAVIVAAAVSVPLLPLLAARRRRAENRRFAALPSLAQDVLLLQKRLASYPADDPKVQEVRLLAERTYQRVTTGTVDAQTRIALQADVSSMEEELREIEEANQAGLEAYRDLHR